MLFIYSIVHTRNASYTYHTPVSVENLTQYNDISDISGVIMYTTHPDNSSTSYIINSFSHSSIECDIDQYDMLNDKKNDIIDTKNSLNSVLKYLNSINWDKKVTIYPLKLSDYMSRYAFLNDISNTKMDINVVIDSTKVQQDQSLIQSNILFDVFT